MHVFVVDWDDVDLENDVSLLEGLGHKVAGAASSNVPRAAAAIRDTHPDVVVAWANREPARTAELLHRAIRTGEANAMPTLFVDADPRDQPRLRHEAAPAIFTDVGHLADGLARCEQAMKDAEAAVQHAGATQGARGATEEE